MDIFYTLLENEQYLKLECNVRVEYHTSDEFLEDFSRWILGRFKQENGLPEQKQREERNFQEDLLKFLERTKGKYDIITREEIFKGERIFNIIEKSKNYVVDKKGKAWFIPD
jgi:hypothetical protein